MNRLTKTQRYILIGVFLFAVLLLLLLEQSEHYENHENQAYKFNLGSFGDSSKDGSNDGFTLTDEAVILDFENKKNTDDDLKKRFNTESYSGLLKNDDKTGDLYKFEDKSNNQIWSKELGVNDPTGGNVAYRNTSDLISLDTTGDKPNIVLALGDPTEVTVDEKTGVLNYLGQIEPTNIFPSVRLTSNKTYTKENQHVFILKAKLPSGKALWPAWWLTGTDEGVQNTLNAKWPTNGEIDIIELVNGNNEFKNVLHMCKNCESRWFKGPKLKGKSGEKDWGKITQCQGSYSGGCFSGESYDETDTKQLTGNGNLLTMDKPEGIFACWWNPKAKTITIDSTKTDVLGTIQFYYWKFDETDYSTEGGPLSSSPNPTNWEDNIMAGVEYWKGELPSTDLPFPNNLACKNNGDKTDCNFNNMKMVFNTTICGDWAGNAFEGGPDKCLEYINSPKGTTEIKGQKWEISYIASFSKAL
jgi:hypothetical protein